MALTRRSENHIVYLEAKHYCLWRQIKKQVDGCDSVEVKNPKTGQVLTKYGYRYDSVSGHVIKLVKYDTAEKYATRYFGFKMHIAEGAETYVLDMPYNGQFLRRFLRIAPNIEWALPLSITVFKGKKQKGGEEMGVWFQQRDATVKPYYTRENQHGMPEATHDDVSNEWDFRAQHRWLVARLIETTIPSIEAAAARVAPPIDKDDAGEVLGATDQDRQDEPPEHDRYEIGDEDVPF